MERGHSCPHLKSLAAQPRGFRRCGQECPRSIVHAPLRAPMLRIYSSRRVCKLAALSGIFLPRMRFTSAKLSGGTHGSTHLFKPRDTQRETDD